MTTFIEVDVRSVLRAGGEPFGMIMSAINELKPGEGLRLLATFKPVPLFHVLGSKGFTYEAKEIGGGDWEVLFSPGEQPQAKGSVKEAWGKVTGDAKTEAEGKADKAEGRVQNAVGGMKDSAREARDKVTGKE